ncbi:MAG: hypothetical protein P4M11_15355 [Candidatus Pacebacteria bacterium]|nr:hypothetical protein [Candidatus Paceibacterota bacterium]
MELVKHLLSLEHPVIPLGIYRAADERNLGSKYPFFITCPSPDSELLAGDTILLIGDLKGYEEVKGEIARLSSNALCMVSSKDADTLLTDEEINAMPIDELLSKIKHIYDANTAGSGEFKASVNAMCEIRVVFGLACRARSAHRSDCGR